MRYKLGFLLVCLLFAVAASAEDHASPVAPNASFDKMKTLAGSWTGTMDEGGKPYPATGRFQVISDGSAVMGWLGEGSPYEMVTVFNMDGNDLMATHYCAAHNQPRFVAVPGSDPNRVVFKFKDGTNLAGHDGHMSAVTFIFDGPDHHMEDWTYMDKQGKESTSRFDFKRKK